MVREHISKRSFPTPVRVIYLTVHLVQGDGTLARLVNLRASSPRLNDQLSFRNIIQLGLTKFNSRTFVAIKKRDTSRPRAWKMDSLRVKPTQKKMSKGRERNYS